MNIIEKIIEKSPGIWMREDFKDFNAYLSGNLFLYDAEPSRIEYSFSINFESLNIRESVHMGANRIDRVMGGPSQSMKLYPKNWDMKTYFNTWVSNPFTQQNCLTINFKKNEI